MAEKNLRTVNEKNEVRRTTGPAPENSNWRLTCMSIGKGKELEGLDVGKSKVDTRNEKFLEEIGFSRNKEGQLTLKVNSNTVESEIVRGNRIVHSRKTEDGRVLYENEKLVKDETR